MQARLVTVAVVPAVVVVVVALAVTWPTYRGRMSRRPSPRLSLAAQILVLQLLVVLATVTVAAAVGVLQLRAQITRQEGARALAVAESVAATPDVRAAMAAPDPSLTLQPLAESVRRANGLTFFVIADD